MEHSMVWELHSIELMHDSILGPAEKIICLSLTMFTRDKSNPNFFELKALNERMSSYPYHACTNRADIPPEFDQFTTLAKSKGKEMYGDEYDDWVIPNAAHGLKWNAGAGLHAAIVIV
jgi:hypothetical protein